MNQKLLDILATDLALETCKEGGSVDRLVEFIKLTDRKKSKRVSEYGPVVKARIEKKKAELLALIAQCDEVFAQIATE